MFSSEYEWLLKRNAQKLNKEVKIFQDFFLHSIDFRPITFLLTFKLVDFVKMIDNPLKTRLNFHYSVTLENFFLFSNVIFEHRIHVNNSILSSGMKRKLAKKCFICNIEFNNQLSDWSSILNQRFLNDTDAIL